MGKSIFSTKPGKAFNKEKVNSYTQDSFENFIAKVGMGTSNPMSGATYSLTNLISRNRNLLEAAYRSSWLVGQAVDVVAEDMTKAGIEMLSVSNPDINVKLQKAIDKFSIWESLCEIIKWARLYGGCLGVILQDGIDYATPLRIEAMEKGSFKGILVLDRWMCDPDPSSIISEISKDFGEPKFYKVNSGIVKFPSAKIHYSRVVRFDGIKLPYYQRVYENNWGLSVIERMYDRLIAFDSATLGISQLMYKVYLRVLKVNKLKYSLAMGGEEQNAIVKWARFMNMLQTSEGLTLLDKEDEFESVQYSFGGVADVLAQLSQQVSGATGIPLVRLFGQSPMGFSTGDTDLRNYYDAIEREQYSELKEKLLVILRVLCQSELGIVMPEDMEIKFKSLWTMTDKEKAEIARTDVETVSAAYGQSLIPKSLGLEELSQSSRITGRFTNITDELIENAIKEESETPPEADLKEPEKVNEEFVPDYKMELETRDEAIELVRGVSGWIGVDLDGTLATQFKWDGSIGNPIPKMINFVKKLIDSGERVKIFTARVKEDPSSKEKIQEFLMEQGLPALEVTNEKDPDMKLLIDDKARQVQKNTGEFVRDDELFKSKGNEPVAAIASGITYKGYVIKQLVTGQYEVYSPGGAKIWSEIPSLEIVMAKINEVGVV